ncbi:cob(I)yrinic acid a,c-diamide adenosyltransferase [Candidatus Poribacteria bacterium]|nr:cob(I)yrinic acid a,c-diamide adenosyltransferase [Candidatus Poribacteria bacterium]
MSKYGRSSGGGTGLIHIYTGEGKGKTTSALGMAVRAVGNGLNVIMIQFLKTSNRYGELKGAKKLTPGFEIVQMGPECVRLRRDPTADKECIGCMECHVDRENPRVSDLEAARRALDFAEDCMSNGMYDLVILDEVNYAVNFNLLSAEEVVSALRNKRDSVEVVLTGRSAHSALIEIADYVTEMREIKHPWRGGATARKGIEY